MINYAEKRDFLRLPIDCKLDISEEGSNEEYHGKVINLSSQGILFISGQKFDVGTVLDLKLTPSNSPTPPMEARVMVERISNDEVLFEIAGKIQTIKDYPA